MVMIRGDADDIQDMILFIFHIIYGVFFSAQKEFSKYYFCAVYVKIEYYIIKVKTHIYTNNSIFSP